MAQRLHYQVFNGLRKEELMRTAFRVLREAGNGSIPFRDFREWMRDQGLWNKERTPLVLEFLGVSIKPKLGLMPRGVTLISATTPEEEKEALFLMLREMNTLLLKVVLESLDTETGGRLHSTHELHRMLSSYIYPGENIPLVDFQAWISWAEASEGIRMVGIRWCLGEAGKKYLSWFQARDVDEILEDEEEEEEGQQDLVPSLSVVSASEDDESVLSTPPVSEIREATPLVLKNEDSGSVEKREVVLPSEAPIQALAPAVAPPAIAGKPGGDEVLRWLQGETLGWDGPTDVRAQDVGIAIPMIPRDYSQWVVTMAVVSIWTSQGISKDWIRAAVEELQSAGVFSALGAGKSVERVLKKNDYFTGKPGLVRLLGALMTGAFAAHVHKGDASVWKQISEAKDSLSRYEKVHNLYLGGAYPVAAFWWVREANSMGVWTDA